MADLSDLTWDTIELLYGIPQFERPVEDTVVQWPATGVALEIEMGTPALWKRGDYVELFQSRGSVPSVVELALFTEDHPAAGNTATLRRRVVYDGQGAIAFISGLARKNPLFPVHGVYQAVQQVLDTELWPHVWTTQTRKVTNVTPSIDLLYDLSAGDEEVVRVYQYNINAIQRIQELPFGYWDFEPRLHSDAASVPAIVIKKVWDEAQPVYVVVKNRPSSTLVAGVSEQINLMVPYMAAAKMMLGRVSGVDFDPSRQERGQYNDRSYARDHYQTFAAEFLRMRAAEHDRLEKEQPKAPRRFYRHPLGIRRLTG